MCNSVWIAILCKYLYIDMFVYCVGTKDNRKKDASNNMIAQYLYVLLAASK